MAGGIHVPEAPPRFPTGVLRGAALGNQLLHQELQVQRDFLLALPVRIEPWRLWSPPARTLPAHAWSSARTAPMAVA